MRMYEKTWRLGLLEEQKKKLEQAQFIELGEQKPFHRCNLKFPEHQRFFRKYRQISKEIRYMVMMDCAMIELSDEMIRQTFMIKNRERITVEPSDLKKRLSNYEIAGITIS